MAPRRFTDEPAPPSLAPIQPPQPGMFDHVQGQEHPFTYPEHGEQEGYGQETYSQAGYTQEYQPQPQYQQGYQQQGYSPQDEEPQGYASQGYGSQGGGWRPRSWHSSLIRIGIAVVVMALGAGGLYWTYAKGHHDGAATGEVPLVKADTTAMKVKPANPGGMQNDTEDAVAYQPNLTGNGQSENLLAAPEDPMAKPQPSANAIAAPLPPPLPPAPEMTPDADQAAAPADQAPATPVPAPPAVAAPSQAVAPVAPPPIAKPATPPKSRVATTANPPQQEASLPAGAIAALTAPGKAESSLKTPPAVPIAGGTYKVQLASTKDAATAKSEWTRMQHAHGELLGGLTPTFAKADLGEKGVFYRIQAGPLRDKAAAEKLCASLKAANLGCIIVKQ